MTTAVTSRKMWTRVSHATLHVFKPDAQGAVIERFWATPGCNGVQCTYDASKHTFEIQCDQENANTCLKTIAQVTAAYISEVKGIRNAPIALMAEAIAGDLDVACSDEDEEDTDDIEGDGRLSDMGSCNPSDDSMDITYWRPRNPAIMEKLEGYFDLLQLKTTTCLSSTEDRLQVACRPQLGAAAGSIAQVMKRLSIIEANLTREPSIHHMLSSDGDNVSRLVLQTLESSGDKALGRILLPPTWWPTEDKKARQLYNACLIRYCLFDYSRQSFIETKRSRKRQALPDDYDAGNVFSVTEMQPLRSKTGHVLREAERATAEKARLEQEGLSTQVGNKHERAIVGWISAIPENALPEKVPSPSSQNSRISPERPTDSWPTRPSEQGSPDSQTLPSASKFQFRPLPFSVAPDNERLGSVADPTRPGRSSLANRGRGRGIDFANGRGEKVSPRKREILSQSHPPNFARQRSTVSSAMPRGGKVTLRGGKRGATRGGVSQPSNMYSSLIDFADAEGDSGSDLVNAPPGFSETFDSGFSEGDLIDVATDETESRQRPGSSTASGNFIQTLLPGPALTLPTQNEDLIDLGEDENAPRKTYANVYGSAKTASVEIYEDFVSRSSSSFAPFDEVVDRLAEEPEEERKFVRSTRHRAGGPGPKGKKGAGSAGRALQSLKEHYYGSVPKPKAHPAIPPKASPSPVKGSPAEGSPSKENRQTLGDKAASCPPRLLRATLEMLEAARSYHGQVKVRCEIGQVILRHVPKHLKSTSGAGLNHLKLDAVQELLSLDTGFKEEYGNFTPCCTSNAEDIAYMMGKISLEQFPSSTETTWNFTCTTTDQQEFKVIVDACGSGEAWIITDEDTIGVTYIHRPQKVFDARLIVTGRKTAPATSNAAIMDLVTSLDNGDQSLNVKGVPELAGRDSSLLSVHTVQLRTKKRYRVPGYKYQIEIVRVYDTDRIIRPTPDAVIEPGYFRTLAQSEEELRAVQGLWFEISIGLVEEPAALLENETLDIGCEAGWKVDDILDRASLGELDRLIGELIEVMDHVGIGNRGVGVELEEKRLADKVAAEQQRAEREKDGW